MLVGMNRISLIVTGPIVGIKEELYYLPDDIGEGHDLQKKNPQKTEELRILAMKARTESLYFSWDTE